MQSPDNLAEPKKEVITTDSTAIPSSSNKNKDLKKSILPSIFISHGLVGETLDMKRG